MAEAVDADSHTRSRGQRMEKDTEKRSAISIPYGARGTRRKSELRASRSMAKVVGGRPTQEAAPDERASVSGKHLTCIITTTHT